jgi:Big-like domain-containing protein/hemolysin type calcium-binding protein
LSDKGGADADTMSPSLSISVLGDRRELNMSKWGKLWRLATTKKKPGNAAGKFPTARRAFLERLESRYVLTAPVAVDDSFFPDYNDVPQSSGPLDVLANDQFTFPALTNITEVNGSPVNTAIGTSVDYGLDDGTLTLSDDHTSFSFTPNSGFTGVETFTYKITEDTTQSAAAATVTIDVHPVTGIGDDVPSFVDEGGHLHLDDQRSDTSSRTVAPGSLTYNWYIDSSTDPDQAFSGNYTPPPASLVTSSNGGPVDHSVSTLDVSWQDLNALGITDGLAQDAVLSLQVIDGNGQSTLASARLSVLNVSPEITSFTVTPDTSGCGGSEYVLNATFAANNNPLDSNFAVAIDWDDFDFTLDPTADDRAETISTVTDNQNGTFSVTATHSYDTPGMKLPILFVTDMNSVTHVSDSPAVGLIADGDNAPFIDVTSSGGGGELTAAIDGVPSDPIPEGTPITLTANVVDPCAGDATNAWSVTKDGNPFTLPAGTITNGATFTFTPDDNGNFAVSLTVTDGDDTATATSATIGVTNVAPSVTPIAGQTQGVRQQGLSYSSSVSDPGTADSETTSWQVLNSTNQVVASGSGSSFAFTPVDVGSYTVTFTATDDDGGSASTSTSVAISATLLQGMTLLVGGTTGDDAIQVKPGAAAGQFKVVVNGANLGNSFAATAIQVYGGAGTDNLAVDGDANSNTFEVHSDHLVTNGVSVSGDAIETRTIDAFGSTDTITVYDGAATVNGGGGSDTLIAAAGVNTWVLTSNSAGSVGQVVFSSIQQLVGTGADTLVGPNNNNVWRPTGASSGTLGNESFTGFAVLQGGTANDTFKLSPGTPFTGSLDGGEDPGTVIDKLDYSAFATSVNVNLASGVVTGIGGQVSRIENVAGGDGNDVLRGDGFANILAGGAGSDILLGGAGSDTLSGGAGRDILIGGTGADLLAGNADEDILIDGTTSFDNNTDNDAALNALLAAWNGASSYAAGVAAVSTGSGVSGGYRLVGDAGATQTVFADRDIDTLTGSGGQDFFFANKTNDNGGAVDNVTDQSAKEFWDDTDF